MVGFAYLDVKSGQLWHALLHHSAEQFIVPVAELSQRPGHVGHALGQEVAQLGLGLAQESAQQWNIQMAQPVRQQFTHPSFMFHRQKRSSERITLDRYVISTTQIPFMMYFGNCRG